jgi:NIPSNAP
MSTKKLVTSLLFVGVFAVGFLAGSASNPHGASVAHAQAPARVFELRTYTSHEGRLADVVNRFRDHTMRIFEKHGMTNVGYWVPQDAPLAPNTLIYIIAHPSREAATRNWNEFRNDPEWKTARAASEANGPIVAKTQSVFMEATGFSPLK